MRFSWMVLPTYRFPQNIGVPTTLLQAAQCREIWGARANQTSCERLIQKIFANPVGTDFL